MKPAGFGYQQQMLAGIRPGGAQMPNYFVPVVPRQGQQGQRAGGRRGSGAPQQQQQPQQQPQQQVLIHPLSYAMFSMFMGSFLIYLGIGLKGSLLIFDSS